MSGLTPVERLIVKFICEQKTNKEIAKALNFSIRTIEDYRLKIQKKTGTKNAVGIALFAVVNGIVKL